MEQPAYLTVTALTKYLKRKFEADPYLERVYLTGEISNFRLRANAHQYFSLKDEKAKISAIMFKGAFQQLKFQPKEGMKVLVVGRIALYEATGQYQIYVEHMEPDGVGAFYQALEQLKEKLSLEGMFQLPKKPLAKFPKRIAVVTSPSGAVIKDIITTVQRRYPIVQVVVYPTLVQGKDAAANIVNNIGRIEAKGDFDTMIIARGGGSIEDLWPFNEESVARAIIAAKTPVISSVGHETDVTIADMVADIRAATPTAAAELSVPVLSDELLRIKEKQNRLIQAMSFIIKQKNQRYQQLLTSYIFRQPTRLYEGFSVKLDLLQRRLAQGGRAQISFAKDQWQEKSNRLYLVSPAAQVSKHKQALEYLQQQLFSKMEWLMQQKKQTYLHSVQNLDLLSPLKIMGRGYTYTTKDQKIIRSTEDIHILDELEIHWIKGKALVEVKEIKKGEILGE